MGRETESSVTWSQALAWRMKRQLLDPVGAGSATDVVRRLGAVLSMDESLDVASGRARRVPGRR